MEGCVNYSEVLQIRKYLLEIWCHHFINQEFQQIKGLLGNVCRALTISSGLLTLRHQNINSIVKPDSVTLKPLVKLFLKKHKKHLKVIEAVKKTFTGNFSNSKIKTLLKCFNWFLISILKYFLMKERVFYAA